jgi:NADP-dependent 3-hydroxy acid dehydrogenase YdfG
MSVSKSQQSRRSARNGFAAGADAAARQERAIQDRIDRLDEARPSDKDKKSKKVPQTGERAYPAPPLPEQHLRKPGVEADLELAPMYEAPHYKGSDKLLDMVALITGGDSGIGRAVAVLYAREGADIAIAYLNEHEDAEETKRAVEKEGRRCILISGDVADPRFCDDAVKRTVKELGKLDILVNNYSMTKGAIHAFARSLASHLVDRGIRVNAISPGPVWTPLNPADKPAKAVAQFGGDTPMKRPAQPEEIAPAFVFMAAPSCASYITGEVLPIIGGYSGG